MRYRGIAKNGAQVFSLLALANLYLARRTLAPVLTTPGHPLPPAAVSGGFDKKKVRLSRKRSHRRVDQNSLTVL